MNRVSAEDSIASRCAKATLSGNSVSINIDPTTPWQSSGGIQVNWVGEASTFTQSKLALQQRDFRLRKVVALVPMTEELSQDAAFLSTHIVNKAGDKIGFAVDNAIMNGNGVTQPTGVVGHAGTVSVTKETSQKSTSLVGNNVIKMWMACEPKVRSKAFWVINPDAQVWLQKMSITGLKDSTATAQAWGQFLFMPAGGLSQSPFDTLFGRPILYHQAAQTVGTVGDITLFSGSEYLICTKATGVQVDSSIHLWFDQAVNALRVLYRVEGQPMWPNTISALNGSQTYGAFVTCATR
jgi:HK97 family phage major capsid protein